MKLRITVHGVSYEVDVEILEDDGIFSSPLPLPQLKQPTLPQFNHTSQPQPSENSNTISAPIAGTVVEIKTKIGQEVKKNDVVLIIEAMKMNTEISSPVNGKVKNIYVKVGQNIKQGDILIEFE